MYTQIHVRTYTHTDTCTHTQTHVQIHTCTYTQTHVQLYMHTQTHTNTHTHNKKLQYFIVHSQIRVLHSRGRQKSAAHTPCFAFIALSY
ncbi:unnamed protein product [Staurois parvus]|uniref:Uncharacterized protein n=1 Tax=Staurois parvus TaxID=386267 RepID=A0ABN9HQT9_9NEOB|nr:unnamed protein product [Staurois parvus]